MRLLLDSHTVIWWVDQDHLLGPDAHAAIADPANRLLLSAASIWEISIKMGLGKLSLTLPFRQWMEEAMTDLGVTVLPITVEYADVQASLPDHHRDPFDRLIVAQAQGRFLGFASIAPLREVFGCASVWAAAGGRAGQAAGRKSWRMVKEIKKPCQPIRLGIRTGTALCS